MKRILLAFLMCSSSALSDVKFSITGTANETKYGYISGQSYTFDFVVNENYSGGNGDIFSVSTSENHWSQNLSGDPNIFSDITANSFTGSYTPVFPLGGEDPGHYEFSIIEEDGYHEVWFTADVGEGNLFEDIGLYMPDGKGISDFAVEIVLEEFTIPYSNIFTSPTVAWGAHYGSYTLTHPNSWFDLEVYGGTDPGKIEFTPTGMVISDNVRISSQINQLGIDIDGEAEGDQCGASLSLSSDGSIIAIGARYNDENNFNSGHVRIYQWDGSFWQQLGDDIYGEAPSDYSGYSVSLSASGFVVAIGARYNDGNGSRSGHVRLYQWDGFSWNQLGSDIDGENLEDRSGASVSLSADGTIVAIGAHDNDGNGTNSGHVRLYQWDGTSWNQLGSDIDGEADNDGSGWSVSLSADGSIVAIGARYNNGNGTNSGHVRLYQWDGTSWNQLGSDIDGEASGDESGHSVSLSADGSIVAIGAGSNDGNGTNSGHVRLYQWDGTSWNQLGNDIDGEAAADYFGLSLDLSASGTIVSIGAHGNDGNGNSAGQGRLYEWNGTTWNQLGSDIDGDVGGDHAGSSISLSSDGSIMAIGAPNNGGSGHVRIFSNMFSDSDDDGLSDTYEINISNTDPNDSDSDDDGLGDAYEINTSNTDPNDSDSDDDGLNDRYEFIELSTNPNDYDSDDDGFDDGFELARGLSPTSADSLIVDYIKARPDTFDISSGGMTMSEAQAAMRDLRVGSQTFDVSNGTATIRMYVDESSDLTSTWSNTQHVLELDIPADADTKFYRFRMN